MKCVYYTKWCVKMTLWGANRTNYGVISPHNVV